MERRGFTLIELLTVIAIIALLLTVLSPALVDVVVLAKRLQCGSGMSKLGQAWTAYASENGLVLVSSNTNNDGWVRGGNTIQSMTGGRLFPYVGTIDVYACTTPRSNPEYYRHFSINGRLNGERTTARRLTEIPDRSRTLLLIEEDDYRGYNVNSWFIGGLNNWVDFVSGNHADGDNLIFVDGHLEYWQWQDPDTLTLPYSNAPFGSPDSGSVDLARIWEVFRPY